MSVAAKKTLLQAANAYLKRGWSVIPLRYRDNDKRPLISWGHYIKVRPTPQELNIWFGEKFTGDLTFDQIKLWFGKWKTAPTPEEYRRIFSGPKNIAIVTGKLSNLAVVDCDSDAAIQLYEKLGGDPNGPYVKTQRGYQFYVKWLIGVGNFQGKSNLPDIDLRGEGGYATAPPSVHWGGHHYQWCNVPSGFELPDFPVEVLSAAYPKGHSQIGYRKGEDDGDPKQFADLYENVDPKKRNMTLTRLAGSWAKDHCSLDYMLTQADLWNSRLVDPLPESEVKTTIESILKREQQQKEDKKVTLDTRINTLFTYTDAGNAERFVSQFGQDLRYSAPTNTWFMWDSKRWGKAERGQLTRMCLEAVRSIVKDGEGLPVNERVDILKFERKSESNRSIQAILSLAKSIEPIPVLQEDFDQKPFLTCFINGTYDFETATLRPHRREDMMSQLAPVIYDPEAKCPIFLAFLDKIFRGEQSVIQYLQTVFGYCLTGDVSEQKMWLFLGDGANGKSTLCNIFLHLLGDYGRVAPRNLLMSKQGADPHPSDLAHLIGARLVIAEESEESKNLSESLVKQLTGSGKISARKMYQEYTEFFPTYKIVFQTNHKPEIREGGRGIWRRLKPVMFPIEIPDKDQVKGLDLFIFQKEASGILNWAIEGGLRWFRSRQLRDPEEIILAVDEYRGEMDYLMDFIEEHCLVGPEYESYSQDVYKKYKEWAEINCSFRWSHKKFVNRMKSKLREKFQVKCESGFNASKTRRTLTCVSLRDSQVNI